MGRHTPREVKDGALLAYYAAGAKEAAKRANVTERAVQLWVKEATETGYYSQLLERHRDELDRVLEEGFYQIATEANAVTSEAIAAASAALSLGEAKEANAFSATARNLATVSAMHNDKRLTLQGRPSEIHALDRTGDDALQTLAKLAGLTIDGTAEEVPTAQLEGA